ncbi:MAG: hydrolase [Alphaproteobacteria bacterium]|nr:hydrolase [Alphaproteobacteria bacterium]
MLIDAKQSLLLTIDVQERLLPAIHEGDRVLANCLKLIEAARRLEIPALCSEQYPKGLGPSVPELKAALASDEIMPKLHFSCAADPDMARRIAESGRRQLILCGVEAHVCVLQSAFGFREAGYDVFVVLDAVSSRSPDSVAAARDRFLAGGVSVVTLEMVLFEWLHQAATPEFRDLRGLIT